MCEFITGNVITYSCLTYTMYIFNPFIPWYISCSGIFGSSYQLIHLGSIPCLPSTSSRCTKARAEMDLRCICRLQMLINRVNSIGTTAARAIKRKNPAQYLIQDFLPALTNQHRLAIPVVPGAVLSGEQLERRYDLHLRFLNHLSSAMVKQEAKLRLENSFPVSADVDASDTDLLWFLSYGTAQYNCWLLC